MLMRQCNVDDTLQSKFIILAHITGLKSCIFMIQVSTKFFSGHSGSQNYSFPLF